MNAAGVNSNSGVLVRKVVYTQNRGSSEPVHVIVSLTYQERLDTLGFPRLAKVYCTRVERDGGSVRLVLEPAPDQDNPVANKCFRTVAYYSRVDGSRFYRLRISKLLLRSARLWPLKVVVRADGDRIIMDVLEYVPGFFPPGHPRAQEPVVIG